MADSLDGWLADVPDWSSSQGNELMDSDDENDLLIAACRADQQGGNPLFAVNMERVRAPRSFHRGVAIQIQVTFSLQPLRPPNGEFQGEAVAEAFDQGLINFIRDPRNGIINAEDYSLTMVIHHSTGTQTWTRAPRASLTDWLQGSERTRKWLENLAKQLNSAESFDATNGEFYAALSFFKTEQCGGKPAKNKPGRQSFDQLLKKKSVITIKNMDELCLARALVSTKAYVDNDPQYQNISKGCGMQGHLAHMLHEESGVPKGTCGYPEVRKMQEHLLPQGYQIKVFEGSRGILWFNEEKFDSAPKKLCLLKNDQHFHGLRSVPALLNQKYYCHECNKGLNRKDAEHHNCSRQNCDKCRRKNGKCVDFKERKPANVYCGECGQSFRGQDCFAAHKAKPCAKFKKCPECCKVYKFSKKKKRVRCLSVPELQGQSSSKSPMLYSASEEEFGNLVDPNMNEEDRGLLEEMIEAEAAEKEPEEEEDHPRSCAV